MSYQITTEIYKYIVVASFTLLGSLITVATVIYTNKQNEKRLKAQHLHERKLKQEEIIRSKAEELLLDVRYWLDYMVCDHFYYPSVIEGSSTHEEAYEASIKKSHDIKHDAKKMFMLTDVYFPEIKTILEKLRDENLDLINLRKGFISNSPSQSYAKKYQQLTVNISEKAAKVDSEVFNIVKNKINNF